MALRINITQLKRSLQNEHLRDFVKNGIDQFLFDENKRENNNSIIFLKDLRVLIDKDENKEGEPLNS